jgi:putative membrane protein
MKKQHVLAAALGVLMVVPAVAKADLSSTANDAGNAISNTANNVTKAVKNTVSPPPTPLSASDTAFINGAAQGGLIEIQDSKLAKKVSSNDSVRAFAQDMIDDHKKADDKLKRIAAKLNVTVPKQLDATKQAQLDSLKTATTADFDQKYIAAQEADHSEAVALFQKEADTGDNALLKDFAAKTLPTLQGHMQKVKQLEAKVPPAATSSYSK